MVKKIKDETEFQNEAMKGLALVDFSATWCGPCKMMAPVLEEVSADLQGKMNFFNVDCDENSGLAMNFGVSSIPALMILKDGRLIGSIIGYQPKAMLMKEINKYL